MTKDIIVLIPGIGGSRLERDGMPIYDLSLGALPLLIWNWVGADLAFTGGTGKPNDGVIATDLFNNQLIPGYFGIDDYDGLCTTLKAVVQDPARQFFKFPYDWRVSNRWGAEALDAFIRPKLHDWRQRAGVPDAKLWLVCHSMGGLVARYFLECLGGADITRHLVTIGTPHRGAPKALNAMVNGLGLGPLDFSQVVRSFASTYELLPHYPVVRLGEEDGLQLVRVSDFFDLGAVLPVPHEPAAPVPAVLGLGPLPFVDKARLQDALEFHAKIRRPVLQRMKTGDPTPYTISCFLNRRQATSQSAGWSEGTLTMSNVQPQPIPPGAGDMSFLQGDGTVPGPSAVPIEWPSTEAAMSVDEKHVAMPSSRVVTDHIYNLANPLDTRAYASGRALDGLIGLTVPPLVLVGEPFDVGVDVIKAAHLTVTITAIGAPRASASGRVQVRERSSASLVFTLREPGSYLVKAKSVDPSRAAISDWVVAISSH